MKIVMKNKRYLIILILIGILAENNLIAQSSDDKIIEPSPGVASLSMPQSDLGVDHYTGSVNFTIPLYTIKDGDLEIPINLRYDGSGIRISQEASNVGLGWSLNVGGAITRTIRGNLPDEYPQFGFLNLKETPLDYVNTLFERMNNGGYYDDFFGSGQTSLMDDYQKSFFDAEPDLYSFNFMGNSGKFTRSLNKKIILQTDSYLTQTGSQGLLFEDRAGYTYDFTSAIGEDVAMNSNNIEYVYYEHPLKYSEEQYRLPNGAESYFPSAYYLRELTSPTGESAVFSYSSEIMSMTSYYSASIASVSKGTLFETCENGILYRLMGDQVATSSENAHKSSRYIKKILSSITTPNYQVFFSGKSDELGGYRKDINHEKESKDIVSLIQILGTNGYVKVFKLHYGYFNSNVYPKSDKELRLRLDSISMVAYTEGGNKHENQTLYRFSYYGGSGVSIAGADLLSKTSPKIDYWGFGGANRALSPYPIQNYVLSTPSDVHRYSKSTMPSIAANGMLKEVTYSTGGKTKLEWEANTYSYIEGKLFTPEKYKFKNDTTLFLSASLRYPVLSTMIDSKSITEDNTLLAIYAKDYYAEEHRGDPSMNSGALFYEVSSPLGEEFDLNNTSDWNSVFNGSFTVRNNGANHTYTDCSMPVVYLVEITKESDKNIDIKEAFRKREGNMQGEGKDRIIDYCVITKNMMKSGGVNNGVEIPPKPFFFTIPKKRGNYMLKIRRGTAIDEAESSHYEAKISNDPERSHPYGTVSVVAFKYSYDLEYNYSSDKYNFAGGVRIKNISEFDPNGGKGDFRSFSYELDNGYSSGVLASVPRTFESFNIIVNCTTRPTGPIGDMGSSNIADAVSAYRFFAKDAFSNPFSRSHIGYSRVAEYNLGKGTKILHFSSARDPKCRDIDENKSILRTNSLPPQLVDIHVLDEQTKNGLCTSQEYRRGNLELEEHYDNSGNLISKIWYNWNIVEDQNINSTPYILSGVFKTDMVINTYESSSLYHIMQAIYHLGRYRLLPYNKRLESKTTYHIIKGDTLKYREAYEYQNNTMFYSLGDNRPIAEAFTDLNTGDKTIKYYTYFYNQIGSEIVSKNDRIISLKRKVFYPKTELSSDYLFKYGGIPKGLVHKEYYKAYDSPLSNTPSNRLDISQNSSYLDQMDVLKETKYYEQEKLIDLGKLGVFKFTTRTGYPSSTILKNGEQNDYYWDGNHLKSIVKNPDHEHSQSTYFDYDGDNVSRVTDPRGVTTFYDYDSFGRLKEVYLKDSVGKKKIIESYDYNYRNQ